MRSQVQTIGKQDPYARFALLPYADVGWEEPLPDDEETTDGADDLDAKKKKKRKKKKKKKKRKKRKKKKGELTESTADPSSWQYRLLLNRLDKTEGFRAQTKPCNDGNRNPEWNLEKHENVLHLYWPALAEADVDSVGGDGAYKPPHYPGTYIFEDVSIRGCRKAGGFLEGKNDPKVRFEILRSDGTGYAMYTTPPKQEAGADASWTVDDLEGAALPWAPPAGATHGDPPRLRCSVWDYNRVRSEKEIGTGEPITLAARDDDFRPSGQEIPIMYKGKPAGFVSFRLRFEPGSELERAHLQIEALDHEMLRSDRVIASTRVSVRRFLRSAGREVTCTVPLTHWTKKTEPVASGTITLKVLPVELSLYEHVHAFLF